MTNEELTGVVLLAALGLRWLDETHEVPEERSRQWTAFAEQFVDEVDVVGDSEEEAYRVIDAALAAMTRMRQGNP